MQIELSEEHQAIQENVAKICAGFDDAYWSAREEEKTFPFEFHRAMADGGWLGITMPAHLGGAGLGVTEAAIMMHTVTSSAGGYSAASCRGAGGGLTRSAASSAWRVLASFTAFSFTGP